MTRGVLIDVAALKGVEMLPDMYEITVRDLQDALKRQNLTLQAGDAIIINTGWGKLWGKDNLRYTKTYPGIGVGAAEWLAKQNPMLIGSDNWSVEVNPNPDPRISSPVHQILLAVNGVHILESLKLDELAAKRVNEFVDAFCREFVQFETFEYVDAVDGQKNLVNRRADFGIGIRVHFHGPVVGTNEHRVLFRKPFGSGNADAGVCFSVTEIILAPQLAPARIDDDRIAGLKREILALQCIL